MNRIRRWSGAVVGMGLLLLLLLIANGISIRLQDPLSELNIGFRADRHFLTNFYDQEEDARGIRYRWTRAESTIHIAQFLAVAQPVLVLDIGGIPPVVASPRPVQLYADRQPWLTLAITPETRQYQMLLPPDTLRDGDLRLTLISETSRVPPDRRDVGIRLDSLHLGWLPGIWVLPTWQTILAQWALVGAALAAAWRLELTRRWLVVLAVALSVLLAWMSGYDPFVAAQWQYRLLIAVLVTLIVVWGIYPRAARLLPTAATNPASARAELRTLLLLTLLALAVRLIAALFPTFDSHDWYIHEERMWLFQHGSILLFDRPAEFSRQLAIVPPAFYVLAAPLTLLTIDTVPTTHGVFTFLDGISVFLLGILVRQMGGSARAARLALLLLAFLPIQFTALWWGFGPQVIGQALFLVLVVFAAHSQFHSRLLWSVAGVVLALIALVHNGVALLGGGWLAGYVALTWLFERHDRQRWLGWTLVAAICALVALVLLYSDVVALQLQGVSANERLAFTTEDIFRVKWTLGSLCASFLPLSVSCDQFVPGTRAADVLPQIGVTLLGMLLPLLGLLFLLWRVRGTYRWLTLAWLASAGAFFAVDLAFGLQVRYAYFVVPLVCAGVGMLLDRLALRSRWGWLLPLCVVTLVALAGLTLWYTGVVPAIKPSLRPLTH